MSKRLGMKRSALQRLTENINSIMATAESKRVRQSPKAKLKICRKLKLKPDPTSSFLRFNSNETIAGTSLETNKNDISKQRTIPRTWIPPLKVGGDFDNINKWKKESRCDGNMESVPNVKDSAHCSTNPTSSSTPAKRYASATVTTMEYKSSDSIDSKYDNPFNNNYKVNKTDDYSYQCSEVCINQEPNTNKRFGLNVNTQSTESGKTPYDENNQMQIETENLPGFDKDNNFKGESYSSDSEQGFSFSSNYRPKENQLSTSLKSQALVVIPRNSNEIAIANNAENNIKLPAYKNVQDENEMDLSENVGGNNKLLKGGSEKLYCDEDTNLERHRNLIEIQPSENNQRNRKSIISNKDIAHSSTPMEVELTPDNEIDMETSQQCSQKVEINKETFNNENDMSFNDLAASANTVFENEELNKVNENLKVQNSSFGKLQIELHDENTSYVNLPLDISIIQCSQIGTSNNVNEERNVLSPISTNNSSSSSTSRDMLIKDHSSLRDETATDLRPAMVRSPLLKFYENQNHNKSINNDDEVISHDDCTQDTIPLEDISDIELEKSKDKTIIDTADNKSRSLSSVTTDLIDRESNNLEVLDVNNSDDMPLSVTQTTNVTVNDVSQQSLEHESLETSNQKTNGKPNLLTPCENLKQQKKYEDLIECSDDFFNIPMSQVIKIENEYKKTTENEVKNKLENNQLTTKARDLNRYQTSVSSKNDIVALPLPPPPNLGWVKKLTDEKQRLRSIIQEINKLNSTVLQARKEIWPHQFNKKN